MCVCVKAFSFLCYVLCIRVCFIVHYFIFDFYLLCSKAFRHERAMLKACRLQVCPKGPLASPSGEVQVLDRSCPCCTADGRNDSTVLESWCLYHWRSRDVPAVTSAAFGILLFTGAARNFLCAG